MAEPSTGACLGSKFESVDAAIAALESTKEQDDAGSAGDDVKLKHLNLSCSEVDSDGLARLTEVLSGYEHLETINLAWNNLPSTAVAPLSATLTPMQALTEIDLKYNEMRSDGAEALAQLLKGNTSVTILDLVKNGIPAAGAEAIADALKSNQCLLVLRLGMNDIGDDGVLALSSALAENSTLTQLEVDKNDVGPKGAQALASTLLDGNSTLFELGLKENSIGDLGAQELAKVVAASAALQKLDVSQNDISEVGAELLSSATKDSPGLELLDLSQHELSEEMHSTLEELNQASEKVVIHHQASPLVELDGGEAQDLDGDSFEEACVAPPEEDLQEVNPTATVQRMLGLVEDQDDIAFDNATWYLNSQPEIAEELWRMALASGQETPQVRCLEIFRHVVQQATASQVMIGLDEAATPVPVRSACEHLPQVVAMLSQPPTSNVTLTTTFGVVQERFGILRSHALDLIVDLVDTRKSSICDQIAALDALPVILDKFFAYSWNSAVHSTVLHLVELIFDVEESSTMGSLQRRLLQPPPAGCGFRSRLMDAYEANTPEAVEVKELEAPPVENQEPMDPESAVVEQKLVAASKNVGFMAAVMDMGICYKNALSGLELRMLADELRDAGNGEQEATRWDEFSANVLERVEDASPEKRCLGGEKPRPNPTCGQQ